MRTAVEDIEVNGTFISAGQDVLLSYWSANVDEDAFADPFTFDITRSPNKHLGFGFGAHYCLGATLARRELRALFSGLVPRIRPGISNRKCSAQEANRLAWRAGRSAE
jgi:cytochrome P450